MLSLVGGAARDQRHARPSMIHMEPDVTIPAGAVTTADLYRELIGMRVDVTRVITKLDTAEKVDQDHEARIRQLERFRFTLLGATIAASALFSGLGAWIAAGVAHP